MTTNCCGSSHSTSSAQRRRNDRIAIRGNREISPDHLQLFSTFRSFVLSRSGRSPILKPTFAEFTFNHRLTWFFPLVHRSRLPSQQTKPRNRDLLWHESLRVSQAAFQRRTACLGYGFRGRIVTGNGGPNPVPTTRIWFPRRAVSFRPCRQSAFDLANAKRNHVEVRRRRRVQHIATPIVARGGRRVPAVRWWMYWLVLINPGKPRTGTPPVHPIQTWGSR